MYLLSYVVLLCTIFFVKFDCAGPPSSCPTIFKYHFNGTKWQGIISINDIDSDIIKLEVKLSIAAILPTKYSGEIRIIPPTDNLYHQLTDRGLLNYKVLFPVSLPLPVVTLITLNGVRICSGPPVPTDEPSIHHHAFSKGSKRKVLFEEVCGLPNLTKPLIVNGNPSEKGAHPWHVALYVKTDLGISYMCGGNLVSDRHVLTAAHCIKLGSEGRTEITPENFLVWLGKYKMNKYNEAGSQIVDVKEIFIHPEHNLETADADLAILTLNEQIEFTRFIRPICLYTSPQNVENFVDHTGVIAGWGRDEFGNKMTTELKDTRIKIVSQETCLRSHMAFRDITSHRTFCAGGHLDGSGPCTGDSGGGLTIQENGRWFLYGLISRSLVDKGNSLGCDTHSFTVFADVSKFSDWIFSIIR